MVIKIDEEKLKVLISYENQTDLIEQFTKEAWYLAHHNKNLTKRQEFAALLIESITKCIVKNDEEGEWIPVGVLPTKNWTCPKCGGLVEMAHYAMCGYYDFCPCCGKRIRKEEEE